MNRDREKKRRCSRGFIGEKRVSRALAKGKRAYLGGLPTAGKEGPERKRNGGYYVENPGKRYG